MRDAVLTTASSRLLPLAVELTGAVWFQLHPSTGVVVFLNSFYNDLICLVASGQPRVASLDSGECSPPKQATTGRRF